jgi:hypothetical protein
MPTKLRFYDMKNSDLPEVMGYCVNDPRLANVCNRAELQLLNCKEAGDEGWLGTWAEIEFTASRCSPTVILPREVARLESIDVCGRTVQVNNQLWEYLLYGNGRMGREWLSRRRSLPTMAYSRNNAVTQMEFGPAPQMLSVYITNPNDAGLRILFQGLDTSNSMIYSQDGQNNVQGVYVTFALPFSTAPMAFNRITGIQKDITQGQVLIYQVDPVTGNQVLLLTMEPTEQTAWYRRYLLDPLPWNCCQQPSLNPAENYVRCTAIATLEHIDVAVDSDYFLIQEKNALILEAQSIKMSKNESDSARAQAREYHLQAVRLLIGQTSRYLGKDSPAIQFKPFGSATLARAGVGRLI